MKNSIRLPKIFLLGLCIALVGLPTAFAQGGPPMLTDDPGTPGDKHWEINTAWTMTHTRSGDRTMETPLLDINFGIGEHLQLKYEAPWLITRGVGEKIKGGLGDSAIGVKWRFLDEENDHLDASVYPQFSFNSLASSRRRGLVEEGSSFLLPFEFHGKAGGLEWNAEIGHEFQTREADEWLYGFAVGRELNQHFEIAAEIHGEGRFTKNDDQLIVNLGGRLKLGENRTLLFSAGRSLNHLHGAEFNFVGYLGLQFTY